MSQLASVVDLRSDTVTRPTAAMRAAMAAAEVGDDVFGDDPTVNALQERIAALLGKEAALFVPSGTQSNLCALMATASAATRRWSASGRTCTATKAGGMAVLGSIQPQPLPQQADGTLLLADIEGAIKPDDAHFGRTRLLCLENTWNGQVLADGYLAEATALARRHGLATHLDGARLFNAAALPAGSGAAHDRAPLRQRVGLLQQGPGRTGRLGAVRLGRRSQGRGACARCSAAACGRPACWRRRRCTRSTTTSRGWPTTMRMRSAWPTAWRASPGVRWMAPDTNIVFAHVADEKAQPLLDHLRARGVLATGLIGLRFVTHLDVDAAGVDRAIAATAAFMSA